MKYKTLVFEIENSAAIVTLNRPEKLNALNQQTFIELDHVFCETAADSSIKGVLLTGAGEKAFAAGADISEIQDLSLEEGRAFSIFGQNVFNKIEQCSKPVIALINGFALGGGCELAMSCHLRIASENAKFGQPEVNLGLIPGYGGTQRLPRLIGRNAALEFLLTGNMFTAQQALQYGLVNKVVPAADLADAGRELLDSILAKGPLAVKYILETVNRGLNMPLYEALRLEADYFGTACASEDKKEGTCAFLEKRRPQFKGK